MIHYLKYFLFIAFNWNIRLAWFTIYHEIRGEKKYRLNTGRIVNVKKLSLKGGNVSHAEMYQGANYYLLENIFEKLRTFQPGSNITDYGCGKGRALVVAAHYGFTDLKGLDFAKELCEDARRNTANLKQSFNGLKVEIIHADAAEYKPANTDNVFFFFNPFNEIVMQMVLQNILASFAENPQPVYVVYLNPVHKELFTSVGFTEIFLIKKLRLIEGVILFFPGHHFHTSVDKIS